MTDSRLGYILYRSNTHTALDMLESLTNGSPTVLPSWVLVYLFPHVPENSPFNLLRLWELSRADAHIAYWLHTPEAWRMAVQTNNEALGKKLRRPKQYGDEPPEDLVRAYPFPTGPLLRNALGRLADPRHPLYNSCDPSDCVVVLCGDDHAVLASLFRHHYWELMADVLPHRWDLVEYMMHAFRWTENELSTVLDTLPLSPAMQPRAAWFQYWYSSGIARVSMCCMLKRLHLPWLDEVWLTCYSLLCPYVATPLDCYQLQTECTPALLRLAFTLPHVNWTGVLRKHSTSAVQHAIMDRKFTLRFTRHSSLLLDTSSQLANLSTSIFHSKPSVRRPLDQRRPVAHEQDVDLVQLSTGQVM